MENKYPLHKTKFITLLRTLDRKELSAFGCHIRALYPKQEATSVFKHLKNWHPELKESKKLEAFYLFKKIFKREMKTLADRKKLLNCFHDLHIWLQDYLLLKSLKNKSLKRELMWLEILKERKLDQLFFLKISKLKKDYEALPAKNIWHYSDLLLLNHLEFFHTNSPKLKAENHALDSCTKYLDLFYATAKLKYASEEINRKNLLETPSSIKFADLAFDIVNNSPKQNLPLLYKLLFQFNKNPSMPLFQEIKQLLFSHSEDFDLEEQLITLGYLLNYTASKIKHGETRYLKEAFDLNQYGISTGMLIQDGFIPPSQFHNIVNLACWLKKFNWAQTFVETHSEHLREPFRKDAKLLAQTIITFEKQDFLNVVETLKEVEFSDGHFALRAKSLILRSYIEQAKDADQVLLFCESFERFIRRHSVIKGETETAALNFIKFIKMLTRKKTSEPKLKSEIAEAHPVFFKPWLIQKAAAYKQKFAAHTLRR